MLQLEVVDLDEANGGESRELADPQPKDLRAGGWGPVSHERPLSCFLTFTPQPPFIFPSTNQPTSLCHTLSGTFHRSTCLCASTGPVLGNSALFYHLTLS